MKKKGLKILKTNLELKFGEIDILAETENKTLVLIEVKTKTNLEFGQPFEMVNARKKRKLVNLGKALTQIYPQYESFRIDVVSIDLSKKDTKIEYLENAF